MRSEPIDTKHRRNNILYLHTLLSCSADVSRPKLDFIAIIGLKGWNNCAVCMFCSWRWGFPQGSPATAHNSDTQRWRKLVSVSTLPCGYVHKCVISALWTFVHYEVKPIYAIWQFEYGFQCTYWRSHDRKLIIFCLKVTRVAVEHKWISICGILLLLAFVGW